MIIEFERASYILAISLLLDTCIVYDFSKTMDCFYIFFTASSEEYNFAFSWSSVYECFLLSFVLFMFQLKMFCLPYPHENFSPVFFKMFKSFQLWNNTG